MKNNRIGFGILIALIAIAAITVAPVSADAQMVGISGNIAQSFSFSLNTTEIKLGTMSVGANHIISPNNVTVLSNVPFTVKVKDKEAHNGKLTDLDRSGMTYNPAIFLTNPLQVSTNGDPAITLGNADQTLHTATTGQAFDHWLVFDQQISVADPVLTGTSVYYDVLTVTGATS